MSRRKNFHWGLTGAIALLVASASYAHASSVTLAWDPSPDHDVVGYRLHHGAFSRHYPNTIDTGASTMGTISNLVAGVTYYFAVTAYNSAGLESLPSAEISYTVPPPTRLQIVSAPASQTATLGTPVTLTVQAISPGLVTYQWHKDGVSIRGATGPSYTISSLDSKKAGSYYVTTRDGLASLVSTRAAVSMVRMVGAGLISITGTPGTRYRIHYKDEISSRTWTELDEIVLPHTPFYYTDFSAQNSARRFYQIVPVH
jgi:hypothetical protein